MITYSKIFHLLHLFPHFFITCTLKMSLSKIYGARVIIFAFGSVLLIFFAFAQSSLVYADDAYGNLGQKLGISNWVKDEYHSLSATQVVSQTEGLWQNGSAWEVMGEMYTPRGGLGAAAVNGKIYALGGSVHSHWPGYTYPSVVDANEEYDPIANRWVSRKPMPTARAYFGIAVYHGMIYCIGGFSSDGATGVVEVYDPTIDTWEPRSPLPTEALVEVKSMSHFETSAAVLKDKIHVVVSGGGHYVYDPETDTWTRKTPLPVSKFNNVLVELEAKLYAISEDSMYVYDSENDSWRAMTPPPTPLYHATAVATSGYLAEKMICVFSSDLIVPVFGYSKAGYTFIYFPENDSWIQSASMPTGRVYPGVAAYKDIIYVIGGFTPVVSDIVKPSNKIERFLPPGYGMVPPLVRVLSPENTTYATGNVSLVFAVDRPVVWMGYSLNGHARRPVDGNVTLVGLAEGAYALTVYAVDGFGNTAASETVCFAVVNPVKAMLLQALAVILPAAVAIVAVVVIKRCKRRRPQPKQSDITFSGSG
jgi:hypothetical protein